jgi:hypothetical protein
VAGDEPKVVDEKDGPLVSVSDPPLPSVKVSTKVKPDKVTLPLFSTVMV